MKIKNLKYNPKVLAIFLTFVLTGSYFVLDKEDSKNIDTVVEEEIEEDLEVKEEDVLENVQKEVVELIEPSNRSENFEKVYQAILNNENLTNEEKNNFFKIQQYVDENFYLDVDSLCNQLFSIDVIEQEQEDTTSYYKKSENVIKIKDRSVIDSISYYAYDFSGGFDDSRLTFLQIGLPYLLYTEYTDISEEDLSGIPLPEKRIPVFMTECVIEMTSPEVVLEAFSKKDPQILIQKLSENTSEEDAWRLLENLQDVADSYNDYKEYHLNVPEDQKFGEVDSVLRESYYSARKNANEVFYSFLDKKKYSDEEKKFIENYYKLSVDDWIQISTLPTVCYNLKIKDDYFPTEFLGWLMEEDEGLHLSIYENLKNEKEESSEEKVLQK